MATVKVTHKTRAYIGGRTYDPGEVAEIDEKDFNESTHTLLEGPKVEERKEEDEDEEES